MTPVDHLLAEALALPFDQRRELAAKILASFSTTCTVEWSDAAIALDPQVPPPERGPQDRDPLP